MMVHSLVIGVDVGGTNTDAVLMRGRVVLAWHKTPTTADVSIGVSAAIEGVLDQVAVSPAEVTVVKIGTTQFLNASLEQDCGKIDKVAVLRLCGPYTQTVAPFLGFPRPLRRVIEGYYAYVDGGIHVDGRDILPLCPEQLRKEAQAIKSRNIRSVVLVGIHSTSFSRQETNAAQLLSEELGEGFDVSCSHQLGHAGFLTRENTAILNASIRRYAQQAIASIARATGKLLPRSRIFMTLNDGTVGQVGYAAQYPLKCFFSGPTNSARGAAFIAMESLGQQEQGDDLPAELLVIDVGGTTTDVCGLLPNGYPKASAAFIKIAGVKTNLSSPQLHNIALGGGSVVRPECSGVSIGPDSVGAGELTMSLAAGGTVCTASDLTKLTSERLHELGVSAALLTQAKDKVRCMVEAAVDFAKTRPVDARVILVGGGSFILSSTEKLKGVRTLIKPEFYQVANAIGAAIAKISGRVDRVIVPQQQQTVNSAIEDGKREAIQLCCEAGGIRETAEIVDLDIIPETYSFNGAFRLVVRAVTEVDETRADAAFTDERLSCTKEDETSLSFSEYEQSINVRIPKTPTVDPPLESVDMTSYKPRIENNLWTLTETDIDLLIDGTGVLGVGCMGEATNYLLALKEAMRSGQKVQIVPLSSVRQDDMICPTCWIGSPTVFFERLPGGEEVSEAMYANLSQVGKSDFTHTIPSEIGGPNALEALLQAAKLGKLAVDADLMGRAFPRAYMTIPGVHGKTIPPTAVSDGNGAIVLLKQAKNDYQAEDILRTVTDQLGGIAALALRPFSGSETHLFAHNSYSLAWSIGYNMHLARQQKSDVASAIVSGNSGQVLFRGKVSLVSREVQNSFTRGTCTILPEPNETTASGTGWLELLFENEISAAILRSSESETCLAVTPDLMAIVDSSSGEIIGITELKYGLHVAVIALRAPEIWYSAEGLRRAGPAVYGFPESYRSCCLQPAKPPVSLFDKYNEAVKS